MLRSDRFAEAHAIVQAAYAHYAFTLVHPFQDGNGRVARLLASLYTYRAASVPVLVLSDQKGAYRRALAAADSGDIQPFVDFVSGAGLSAMALVTESLRAAEEHSIEESLAEIDRQFVTVGGFRHEDVDVAAVTLLQRLQSHWSDRAGALLREQRYIGSHGQSFSDQAVTLGLRPGLRLTLGATPRSWHYSLGAASPVETALVQGAIQAEVPANAKSTDYVYLRWQRNATHREEDARVVELLAVRLDDLLPEVKPSLDIRLGVAVERIIRASLSDLAFIVANLRRRQFDDQAEQARAARRR